MTFYRLVYILIFIKLMPVLPIIHCDHSHISSMTFYRLVYILIFIKFMPVLPIIPCDHSHISSMTFYRLVYILIFIKLMPVLPISHSQLSQTNCILPCLMCLISSFFHVMLVALFMLRNGGGPGKHVIISDAIGWQDIFQPTSSNIHFRGKLPA